MREVGNLCVPLGIKIDACATCHFGTRETLLNLHEYIKRSLIQFTDSNTSYYFPRLWISAWKLST